MKPLIVRRAWDLFAKTCPRWSCEIDLWRRNKYFEDDLWLVPRFCQKDKRAVDVGVNAGIFSLWMSKYAAAIDSFECNPKLLDNLKRFLPRNVELHACALSSSSGETTLRFDPNNTGIGTIESNNRLNANPGIKSIVEAVVPMRRLDEFNLTNVSFMKIDVEGHELEVLKGAVKLIESQRPALLIEIEERHCAGNVQRVPQWLEQYGYQTFCFDKSTADLVLVTDPLVIANNGINNFWFVPKVAS